LAAPERQDRAIKRRRSAAPHRRARQLRIVAGAIAGKALSTEILSRLTTVPRGRAQGD
jgi:hypothetical protein